MSSLWHLIFHGHWPKWSEWKFNWKGKYHKSFFQQRKCAECGLVEERCVSL